MEASATSESSKSLALPGMSDAGRSNRSSIVPPFWQHQRTVSQTSLTSNGKPPLITLEDHTEEVDNSITSPLWAKVVTIESHTIVSGNVKGLGDYCVWNCVVDTLDGGKMTLRKRYSEFETLRAELVTTFPRSSSSLPELPSKSVLYRFRASFLERRRVKLEYFLNCVLLNPEFSSSAILKEFIFT